MTNTIRQWRGLPYLTGICGVIIAIIVWYLLITEIRSSRHLPIKQSSYPWMVLTIGICIALLIATITHIAQVAHSRAVSLNAMNQNLKKEISERMHAEAVKRKLEIALLQGQKLQSIGTLAAGIAHDFNNILYAIIGFSQLAQQDVEKDSIPYKNVGKTLSAAFRGRELIARILAFSRRQHIEFSPIHLHQAIEAALSLLRPTIPASVSIEFQALADVMIQGNQTQLHQVLVNMITNAVDAMHGAGLIHITMSKVLANDPFLEQFPRLQPGNYAQLTIQDNGQGMDQPTIKRIFEPFFTTKEVGKGTGLGMSIAHSIIKEHHGEVYIESQLGAGTTFTILLPEYPLMT